MPIIRWVIICLAVWLAIRLLRRMIENRQHRTTAKTPGPATVYPAMVACHHCNLHVPKAEALQSGDRYYCGTQHRDADIHPA